MAFNETMMTVTHAMPRAGTMSWRGRIVAVVAGFMLNLALILWFAPTASAATTHRMSLTHHEFTAWEFSPQTGDRIEITNHSDISHSLYITYPDGTVVNLDVQLPGATVNWTIPAGGAGNYLLQCWIHPIIRATLTVTAPVAPAP